MKYVITYCEDIFDINDSMEVESGTELARLQAGDNVVTLEVKGDVRVRYKGEIYKTPAQFPRELLDLFHDNEANAVNGVEVIDNNWGELFYWTMKNGTLEWTGDSELVDDISFKDFTDLVLTLKESLESYLEDVKKSQIVIERLEWCGACFPYRNVTIQNGEDEENVEIKVTKSSFITSGLIIEGSPLDDQFSYYVEDKKFDSYSDKELQSYVNENYG